MKKQEKGKFNFEKGSSDGYKNYRQVDPTETSSCECIPSDEVHEPNHIYVNPPKGVPGYIADAPEPTVKITFGNLDVRLIRDKKVNRFQRFMYKVCFGLDVENI